jgi:hypothetical protein
LLALKYHPDKCTLPDSQARFQSIKEAYEKITTHIEEGTPLAQAKQKWEFWIFDLLIFLLFFSRQNK